MRAPSFLRRLRLVTVFTSGVACALAQSAGPPVLSQTIPAQTVFNSGTTQTVSLGAFITNPTVPGTAVRISVNLGISGTGNIDLALTDQQTPLTVANFLAYINAGAYANNFVHRSMPGFVIQDGGFYFASSTTISAVPTIPAVQNEVGLSNVRGSIAMAQVGTNSNSATSQWFINLVDNNNPSAPADLDTQNGGFTVFGNVIGGTMTVADAIAAVPIYDGTGLNPAFTNLPLVNYVPTVGLFESNFITTSISVIPGLTFNASSANPNLVTTTVSGGTLKLIPSAVNSGSTTVTITASALDGGTLSTTFGVTVAPFPVAPGFSKSPVAASVVSGQSTTFFVTATGVPAPTLQWQGEPAGTTTFSNLTNSSIFAGVTTATLSVTNATVALSGEQFRCVASNSVGTGILSGVATLTSTPAPATVTLSNLTQTYSGAALPVTLTTTPSGLATTLLYNGSTSAPTNAGTYTLAATITDPNHTGTASGTLVIAKAAQSLTFGALPTQPAGGAPLALSATASSSLTVSYTSANSAVATAIGSTLTPVSPGTTTISATQTGNGNYLAAPSVSQTLTVTPNFTYFSSQYFTTAQLANPAISGPAADPANDGLSNLVKYALGLNPTLDDATAAAPVIGTANGALTLTYICPPGLTDITYVVQVSSDLQTWSSGPTATSVVSSTMLDAQHQQVVVRDLTPISGSTQRFIRLEITQP